MTQIAIISNAKKLSGRLTNFWTGSPAYHIGFVDTDTNLFYDQNLLFRKRLWPHYPTENVKMYECPVEVTGADLEYELATSEDWYGVADYIAFAWRKILPGTRVSFKGVICSEKVEQILQRKGWVTPFSAVPSPADFEKVLIPTTLPT